MAVTMLAPNSPPSLRLPATRSERILDPIDRMTEVLFGLIMALTFTGTLSVATAGREDVREHWEWRKQSTKTGSKCGRRFREQKHESCSRDCAAG